MQAFDIRLEFRVLLFRLGAQAHGDIHVFLRLLQLFTQRGVDTCRRLHVNQAPCHLGLGAQLVDLLLKLSQTFKRLVTLTLQLFQRFLPILLPGS
ncbi:MAG: hypothetical protein ACWGNB_08350, partial [Thiogranum sp.]